MTSEDEWRWTRTKRRVVTSDEETEKRAATLDGEESHDLGRRRKRRLWIKKRDATTDGEENGNFGRRTKSWPRTKWIPAIATTVVGSYQSGGPTHRWCSNSEPELASLGWGQFWVIRFKVGAIWSKNLTFQEKLKIPSSSWCNGDCHRWSRTLYLDKKHSFTITLPNMIYDRK